MFHRHRWINWITSVLFIFVTGSCDGLGAGCGCSVQPLPQGGLPPDQTIEGGAQVRITPAGFNKITSLIPAIINDAVASGLCIPRATLVDNILGSAAICSANVGSCSPGCPVSINLDSSTISANNQTLNIQLQFDVQAQVHMDYDTAVTSPDSCDTTFTINNGFVDMDVQLGIDPNTGELTLQPASINTFNVNINQGSGCGGLQIITAALNLFGNLLDSFIGDLFLGLVDDLLQGLLPDPLGIEGMIDLGELIGVVSPDTNAPLEVRGVPGGFVEMVGNGMTLGVILGLNADKDLTTRTPAMDSEPSLCVPPMAAPDLAAAPTQLPKSARGTFILAAADEFRGAPDPAADIAIGLSETTLDLAGHHAVSSGGLCLGVGTTLIPALDLGRIALLVPSLAELGSPDGHDPLLMVTRPVKPIDFTIGDGTDTSPSLTIHLQDFEIDFYAFLFERYTRGFTVSLSMDVGINLEFTTLADGSPALLPVLTGLDTDNIVVKAFNTEFLREDSTSLEATLPAVLDLALPLVTQGLEPIALPDVAGFSLGDLRVSKVVTSEDAFLAIFATFTGSPALRRMAARYPSINRVMSQSERPPRATTRARLRAVNTPPVERIRAALLDRFDGVINGMSDSVTSGGMPEVVIDVEPYDELGRRLEWTWNINGGMWRPFTSESPLVIRDPALVWQDRHVIEVRARVAGDYRTLDLESVKLPVVIDSVAPRILTDRARLEDSAIVVPATDLVSPDGAIEFAYGHPGDGAPATEWGPGGLALSDASSLALDGKTITVYARDELGNTSAALVNVDQWLEFHGHQDGGCACAAGPTDLRSLGGLGLLASLTLLLLWAGGRRRSPVRAGAGTRRAGTRRWRMLRDLGLGAGLLIGASMLPACDCGGTGRACAIEEDCADYCLAGSIGICLDNQCLCQEVPGIGKIGQYSDMALASDGSVWVSAYNSTYGDLNVARWSEVGRIADEAWEFVDGVPDGPVVSDRAPYRNGVALAGDDVGKYTSIAVNAQDAALVSYFDQETASLKFASNMDGTWQIHTVAQGVPPSSPDIAFEVVGQYSSITLGADGRPGIAYFAHISEGSDSARTEVRYASAQTPTPTGPGDWVTYVIEEAALPPTDPNNPDPLTIPPGVGLFITSVRQSDQTPALVYYDRLNGTLKASRFVLMDGTFSPPEVLDGGNGADVGWYPSVAIDDSDELHITYVSASGDDLLYINTADASAELVDDGYRIVGTTDEGLPKPEFHLVGDDSSVVLTDAGPMVVYQDATTHELLVARRDQSGSWEMSSVAGNEATFAGAFGFYAVARIDRQDVVMSSWVIDPPNDAAWVEIFRESAVQ